MPWAHLARNKIAFDPPREWLDLPEVVRLTSEEASRWAAAPLLDDVPHDGQEVHVLGSGPSLAKYRMSRIHRVGVNGVPATVSCNTWLVADRMDVPTRTLCTWMREYAWSRPEGVRIILKHSSGLSALPGSPLGWLPDGLFEGSNEPTPPRSGASLFLAASSVHAAVNMVARGRPKRIMLYGVDLNDHMHHYGGDPSLDRDDMNKPGEFPFLDQIMHGFRRLREFCDFLGIELLNANPDSAIPEEFVPKWKPAVAVTVPEPVASGGTIHQYKPSKPANREPSKPAPVPPVARCYFTKDYQNDASLCVSTFGAHGLAVQPVLIQPAKTWIKTCMARQGDLASLGELLYDRWVGVLDADLQCCGTPEKLLAPPDDADVMVHDRGADQPDEHRYCAGVAFFAPTPAGRACLAEWARLCQEDPLGKKKVPCREQAYLKQAIDSTPDLRVRDLGLAYNSKPEQAGVGTIIMHHVASRKRLGKSMSARA